MTELSEHARQAIMVVHDRWLAHELAGSATEVLALCVDDVVWLPPNKPALRGKAAVAAWLAAQPESRSWRVTSRIFRSEAAAGLPTRWQTSPRCSARPEERARNRSRAATSGCFGKYPRRSGR